jgi:hypothetical protein
MNRLERTRKTPALLQQKIYLPMVRIAALLAIFVVTPAMAAKVDITFCAQVHDTATAQLRWALAQKHDSKLHKDDSCSVYRNQFYEAAVTRQNVTRCEQGDIRDHALELIDAEIDAFNDLIATSCSE